MRRIWLSILIGAALGVAAPASAAVHRPAPATHRLTLGSHTRVFMFSLSGGFSRGGSFKVTMYGDGQVVLKKQLATSPMHLNDPHIQVRGDALNGLLRLAEAEGFFKMPASKVGPNPVSEASDSCITVFTVEQTKRACIRAVHVPAFNELWAVLEYVSGAQF